MFKYLAAFVVLCLGQQCRCFSVTKLGDQETDVDEFFTQLLYSLSESLVGLYGNEIPIPDFNCAFGNSRMEGRISATGGSLGDLSTLQFENVSVLTTPESILLNVEIRMGNLQVSFDHLEASFRYFSVEGSGRLSAQENLLSVQARMTFTDDQCVAVLNFLKLRIFDQLVVNLSVEQSPINDQLLNRIFEVGMKKHKNLLISKIENRLKEVVNGSLKDICDFLV
ncbi:hypothetical protein J6590_011326 [Homalodisca vitripennis]|nr:hypothetical protein J6590_011326 [Homalodisca vitripennis]